MLETVDSQANTPEKFGGFLVTPGLDKAEVQWRNEIVARISDPA